MPPLKIKNRTYPDLQIPAGYQVVVDQLVPRNGQQVHLLRYQPANLPEEALNREHVTVIYGENGYLYSYNALTQPQSGKLPTEKQAFDKAEQIWQEIDPTYRNELEQLRSLTNQERTYVNDDGETVTIPLVWAKYANTVKDGSYEWVGLGPNNQVVEFERESYWDFSAGRQKTEMWNGDDWILARRGLGPQLSAPWPAA
ncbi:hypothetical protein [Secundilactobacillus folii]|uniref:Uncharacterized protein n=1 Tax=Secundilactobacillus folii TaxID=2678357 RepID=A0A7X2XW23_9LACO|nr:hypothetical protein [Secundilactobacillus folii]MTV82733.1 hypothetical protein [Secundilactobacillus folii]